MSRSSPQVGVYIYISTDSVYDVSVDKPTRWDEIGVDNILRIWQKVRHDDAGVGNKSGDDDDDDETQGEQAKRRTQ